MISVMVGCDELLEAEAKNRTGGENNMCKAIYDMVEDGRQEGRLEGKAEGKAEDVDRICQTFDVTLEAACDVVGISVEQYNQAKERMTEIYV